MIELDIPGSGNIIIEHLVSDVNGTLAIDGVLNKEVIKSFVYLRDWLKLHLVTANMYGEQELIDKELDIRSHCIPSGNEKAAKAAYVRSLGREKVVAIGQGNNDSLMLKEARIGICILSQEGLAVETLLSSDIIANNILDALALLENPSRLIATLRK